MADTSLPGDPRDESARPKPEPRRRLETRDLQEVTARRVERAELVRSIQAKQAREAQQQSTSEADASQPASGEVAALDRDALQAAAEANAAPARNLAERPAGEPANPDEWQLVEGRGGNDREEAIRDESGETTHDADVHNVPADEADAHDARTGETDAETETDPEADAEETRTDDLSPRETGTEPASGQATASAASSSSQTGTEHPVAPEHPGTPPAAAEPVDPPTAALPVIVDEPRRAPVEDVLSLAFERLARWRDAADEAQRAGETAVFEARGTRRRDAADPTSELDRALQSPSGDTFLKGLLDDVIRPRDSVASGNGLGDLREHFPATLRRSTRRALQLGAFAGPGIPWLAVRALARTTRGIFGDEVLVNDEERDAKLSETRAEGTRIRIAPQHPTTLGERALQARMDELAELAKHPDVDELDIEITQLEPFIDLFDFDGVVERMVARLTPLARLALSSEHPALIMLRVRHSEHFDLGVSVLQRLADVAELRDVPLGIAIPVAFPESIGLIRRLAGIAHMRREDLGGPLVIAVTRDGEIARERIEAADHGWQLATFSAEEDVDASMVRALEELLAPEHLGAVRPELDSSLWRDQVLAVALAAGRHLGQRPRIVVPWSEREDAVARLSDVADVIVRAPLSPDATLRESVPYLIRRVRARREALDSLERTRIVPRQAADGVHPDDARLLDAAARRGYIAVDPFRRQERVDADDAATVTAGIELDLFPENMFEDDDGSYETIRASGGREVAATSVPCPAAAPSAPADALIEDFGEAAPEASRELTEPFNPAESGPLPGLTQVVLGLRRGRILRNTFRHAPVTDPSIARNREWARRIQRRINRSELGLADAELHRVRDTARIESLLVDAGAAAKPWGAKAGWERAAVLEKIAKALEANRARLIEVVMAEQGMPFHEVDHEVSRVIDFANHSAHLARQLDRMQGADFDPIGVSLAVPAGLANLSAGAVSVFGALAAGSAVILQPEPRVARSYAVFSRVLWDAELDEKLMQLAVCDDDRFSDEALSRALVTDHRVERVLLTGDWEAARDMLRWRPELPLIGGGIGKNTMIVTPSADLEQAAIDIVRSAFVSTGQTPGHLGNVILVGTLARSERMLELIADAVSSIRVGYPSDPSAHVGPLSKPASGSLRYALTELGEGESWLVEPRQLDDTGRLWTPGVRLGVQPASYTHTTDFPGPVLSIMSALTLDDAIRIQNSTPFGLSAGLHSRDRAEIGEWIRRVEAGNLYVNRELLLNHPQRMPFGGCKRSNIGTRYKSGGPNQLVSLGSWQPNHGEQSQTLHLRGLDPRARTLIETAQQHMPYESFDIVRRSALSDQIAWNEEFGEAADVTNLAFERNLLRYVPVPVSVRVQESGSLEDLMRVMVAAQIARARKVDLSSGIDIPVPIGDLLLKWGVKIRLETNEEHLERLRRDGADAFRIRLIGGGRASVCSALGADADASVWSNPVTAAGRLELLPFLREQSISLAAHRYGEPEDMVVELFAHERFIDPNAPASDPGNPLLGE